MPPDQTCNIRRHIKCASNDLTINHPRKRKSQHTPTKTRRQNHSSRDCVFNVARMGESLIENSGGGLLFGSGGGVLASRPNSSSLPYHSCYRARVESGVYCSWTDPCPKTRIRSGIWWNRRGKV